MRESVGGLPGPVHETGVEEQVARRVAGERHLRRDAEDGVLPLGLAYGARDASGVAREIADDLIELQERKPHADILSHATFRASRSRRGRLVTTVGGAVSAEPTTGCVAEATVWRRRQRPCRSHPGFYRRARRGPPRRWGRSPPREAWPSRTATARATAEQHHVPNEQERSDSLRRPYQRCRV